MNKKKQKLSGTINDYPLVEVKWFDAVSDSSWLSIDKAVAAKPAIPRSLGYKLIQTREKITLFTDYIIDDYEGMAFWMTFAVNDILSGRAEAAWPDFLGIALGYGAQGLHGSNVKSRGRERAFKDLPDAQPELLLSLDYDARYLPGKGFLWNHFKTQLNWIHFPAPAIRFYPDLRFYLLYL